MALRIAGEFRTAALDSRIRAREGVSRKQVKRRFLCRFGRERSCSEEGIGSPRRATTLVFIEERTKLKRILLLPSSYRSRNGVGRAELRASAKAFASGVVSEPLGIGLVSPSGVLPLVHRVPPVGAADRGGPCEQKFVWSSRDGKRNYYWVTR